MTNENLEILIRTLETAKSSGYSSLSPVVPIMETMIDLSLQIGLLLGGEGWWDRRKNPEPVGFAHQEHFANPKLIWKQFPGKRAFNPQLSKFFGDLAKALVVIKTTGKVPPFMGSKSSIPHKRIKPESYHFFRRKARRTRS
jgi:hypothetical protein